MPKKKSSHANRGLEWERILEGHHERLQVTHRAVVFRTPPPVVLTGRLRGGAYRAVMTAKGPPDYVGIVQVNGTTISFAMEAKDCASDRWPFAKLHEHQAKALSMWESAGGAAIVAIRHCKTDTFWLLPWSAIKEKWYAWHYRSLTKQRSARGSSSLSRADLEVCGHRWLHKDGYLGALIRCIK